MEIYTQRSNLREAKDKVQKLHTQGTLLSLMEEGLGEEPNTLQNRVFKLKAIMSLTKSDNRIFLFFLSTD